MTTSAQMQANHDFQRRQQQRRLIQKTALTLVTGVIVLIFVFPIFYWARLSITPYKYVFTLPPRFDFPQTTRAWWSVVMEGRSYSDVILEEVGNNSGVGGAGTA